MPLQAENETGQYCGHNVFNFFCNKVFIVQLHVTYHYHTDTRRALLVSDNISISIPFV